MNLFPVLDRHEASLLIGAVAAYLVAMVMLWAALFFRPDEAASNERRWHRRAARGGHRLLWAGATLHLLALLGEGSTLFMVRAGVAGLFGWSLVMSYLLFGRRLSRATLGVFVTPVALVAALFSLVAQPLHHAPVAQLEGYWWKIHVLIILIGYVALTFAFGAALLYLLQEGLLKRKRLSGLWQRLPSLQVADDLIYNATRFGLAMLTLGIGIALAWQPQRGLAYAPLHDPKVLLSLVTWLTFALYLGARQWLGWRGRRSNMVVVYGFALLVISLFGTPHLLK